MTVLRFFPGGRRLLSSGEDGRVLAWDLHGSIEPQVVLSDPGRKGLACDLSPDGNWVAIGGPSRKLEVFDLTGEKRRPGWLEDVEDAEALRFSPDFGSLAAWADGRVWLLGRGKEVREWEGGLAEPRPTSLWDLPPAEAPGRHVAWIPRLAFSSDGSYLFSANWGGIVKMWDLRGLGEIGEFRSHETAVYALAASPRSLRLAAGGVGTLRLWDCAAHPGMLTTRFRTPSVPEGDLPLAAQSPPSSGALARSPDGSRLASGGSSGVLEIRHGDGTLDSSWKTHSGQILAAAFSPDGSRVATGGADWHARVWDAGRRKAVADWKHREWVNAVAFSPDGRRLATGSADLAIRVGDPEGEPTLEIRAAHAHWVTAVVFLDGGRVIASGGNDEAIRFWDAATGQSLSSIPSRVGAVRSFALSDGGKKLVAEGAKGTQLLDLGRASELLAIHTSRSLSR